MNLLTSLLCHGYSPIGLDIGHSAVKLLQLRRRAGQWEVAASGVHTFGQEVWQDPALRWRYAGQAIDSLLRGLGRRGFRGRRVIACLDCEQVLVKNARLPKMPPADLAEAVRWEAAERFPFDTTDGLVRHVVAGEVRQGTEVRQEVLIFAASSQTIRDSLQMLEQVGCSLVGLDAQPVALARAMRFFMPAEDETGVLVLVDIGGRGSQVVITRGGRMVFAKTIEIGSNDLTRAVTESVGTSFEDAFDVRTRVGRSADSDELAEDSKVSRAIVGGMRPVVERLAQEILLCLRYYSVTFRGNRPGAITFVGGAAHDRILMRLLSEATGAEVHAGQPLASCRADEATCQWGEGPPAGGPEWAVALGCCLKPVAKPGQRPPGQEAGPPVVASAAAESAGAVATAEATTTN